MNQAIDDGTTLCIACQQGHAEVVTTLLTANAKVDQADDSGYTPIYVASRRAT